MGRLEKVLLSVAMACVLGLLVFASASGSTINLTGKPGAALTVPITTGTVNLPGATGKRIRILEILIAPAASVTIDVKDGSTSLTNGPMTVTGLYQGYVSGWHHYESSLSADMNLVVTGSPAGYVTYSLAIDQ